VIDLNYLEKLLPILKSHGVLTFMNNELHIKFHGEQPLQSFTTPNLSNQDHTVNLPINEAELPPDLRTDNINSMDTILNWSTEPTPDEAPLPGTGDE